MEMGAQVQPGQPVQVEAALVVQAQVEAKKVQQDQQDQVEEKKVPQAQPGPLAKLA